MKKIFPYLMLSLILTGCAKIPVDNGAQLSEVGVPIATKYEPSNHLQGKIGEPLELTFYILARYDVHYEGLMKEKSADFKVTYLPHAKKITPSMVKWGGIKYVKVDAFKIKLVPLHAGDFVYNLGKMKIKYRPAKKKEWSPEQLFRTQDIHIKVI